MPGGESPLPRRAGGAGGAAVHERDVGRAQGGRARARPAPRVPAQHDGVRVRRRGRSGPAGGAAVPHRGRHRGADVHVRGPAHRAAPAVHARGMARGGDDASASRTRSSCRRCSPGSCTRSRPTRASARPRCARSPTAAPACRRPCSSAALELLPDTGFVNAYGLTETSSTVCVLGPDDHRTAVTSDDEAVRARLASVGAPVPGHRGAHRGRGRRGRHRHHGRDPSARRAGVGPVRRCRLDPRRRRLAGDTATSAGSMPTATCSSRDVATTRSSAAARTSPRPRSRMRSCTTAP